MTEIPRVAGTPGRDRLPDTSSSTRCAASLRPRTSRLTPLDRMIDEATGHDVARLAEAEEIIAEIKTMRAEWAALTAQAQ